MVKFNEIPIIADITRYIAGLREQRTKFLDSQTDTIDVNRDEEEDAFFRRLRESGVRSPVADRLSEVNAGRSGKLPTKAN